MAASAPHVETLVLPHLPSSPIHVALFKQVENAPFLRQQLLDGNPLFEYAFLDATSILSTGHLLAAAFRAVTDLHHARLKSRNVHSEMVFSLSPNNNIADSFRKFGITDTTTSLLAVKLGDDPTTAATISQHLGSHVQGESVPFSDDALTQLSDLPKIKKLYKISDSVAGSSGGASTGKKGRKGPDGKRKRDGETNGGSAGGAAPVQGESGGDEGTLDRAEMESVIIGMMSLRGS